MKGKIKKLTNKGYGFISIDGEEDDLFFHSNDLVDVEFEGLSEGDEVTFEKGDSPKGAKAEEVTPA